MVVNSNIKQNQELIRKVIEDGHNLIYCLFNNESVGGILSCTVLEKTPWRKQQSIRSLQIKCEDTKNCADIATVFSLDAATFEDKYKKAISGFEEKRIRTLHSSSLLCLLCFYGVSDTRPIVINLDGHPIRFNESIFEEKNPVGKDEARLHESNVDVVLKGKDSTTGRNVILFLEAKFSEYLSVGNQHNISNRVYGDFYQLLKDNDILRKMGLDYKIKPSDPSYSSLSSVGKHPLHYAGGIKQMISHFIGVRNAVNSGKYNDYDVYLGTILYQFNESIDPSQSKFMDYSHVYKILAEGLNPLTESRFKVLNQCLTYQEVFKAFDLDERVKSFYSL